MKSPVIQLLTTGAGRLFLSISLIFLSLLSQSCTTDNHSDLKHDHSHEAEAPEHHEGDEIVVMPEVAQRMGVVTDTVSAGSFHETITVGGEITSAPSSQATVTAPVAGTVSLSPGIEAGAKVNRGTLIATVSPAGVSGGDPNAAALANLNAAKRELDRLTPLHADGIVSTRDYNAAIQAYETAKAAYSPGASGGRATSPIAGSIVRLTVTPGAFVNAGDPIAEVASTTTLTLRADLPDRYASLIGTIGDANFRTPYSDIWYNISELGGHSGSSAGGAGTASGPGYSPIYFTFANPGGIVSGTFAEVTLLGSQRDGVISVPTEALSEQQGAIFVYIKTDDHGYEKRAVKTGGHDGRRTEITGGLRPGEEIVVRGATIIRLAESSGAVPEGHSHSH